MAEMNWHPAWLRPWPAASAAAEGTPADTAALELGAFFEGRPGRAALHVVPGMGEGYRIGRDGEGYTVEGGESGVLYGAHALIRALRTEEEPPRGEQAPYYALRMLNCWDNLDGSVERGYAGRSVWFEDGRFRYDPDRIRYLGRLLSSVGINALCLNNVNVTIAARELIGYDLEGLRRFADLLRPYAVRLMVSVDFSMPMGAGLDTADPCDERVAAWWRDRADRVYRAVPDLAGFVVKADSEHRPGPHTYGRTHAEGANVLARALKPHGGVLVWRAFVYNCLQDWRDRSVDRPRAAYDLYRPLDGAFDDNVILQIKYGPYDFQVREPVSPLFFAMERTSTALEVQLTQEYTGHQIDLYTMPPQWREILDDVGKSRIRAMAAVANLGRDANWTGHPLAQANLYAFGLFAWDPDSDPGAVIAGWARQTWGFDGETARRLTDIMLRSRGIYELYTAPLGLCWMVNPHGHYGPSPYGYEFQAWGTYNRADRNAVGIDRTEAGTGYVSQYPAPLRDIYADPARCPDELKLFFHRLPYAYVMADGRTLIQRIYDDHFEGAGEAEAMEEALKAFPFPEEDRRVIAERAEKQTLNAREWRDVINTFFYRLSGVPDGRGRVIYP